MQVGASGLDLIRDGCHPLPPIENCMILETNDLAAMIFKTLDLLQSDEITVLMRLISVLCL